MNDSLKSSSKMDDDVDDNHSKAAKETTIDGENLPSPKETVFSSSKQRRISATSQPMTAGEYATSVNQWLYQCYYWQTIAFGFPYFVANVLQQNGAGSFRGYSFPSANFHPQSSNHPVVGANFAGREFMIPPLWKRFTAELIDFLILFILKLIVTFLAIDFFEVIDLEKYDLEMIREEILDYKLAFEVTSEIVMLEIIHKFVACLFEALCLYRGPLSEGGATPGKSILGLKVVSCENIQETPNGRVLIRPGRDLGFLWALLRSFIKNFSIALFFPICFTLFMFQHNRSAYDIFCNSVVVEDVPRARQPART